MFDICSCVGKPLVEKFKMKGRKRKQLTLARWKDFIKEVDHRGKRVKVSLPTEPIRQTTVTCDIC